MRKASDQEAHAKQDEMVQATLRKLTRRLYNAQNNRRADEHSQYIDFLEGCRFDVVGRQQMVRRVA